MATVIAYDCKCGERYSVYMPAVRFIFDPEKKYIQAAKKWDDADAASGKIKEAEQSAAADALERIQKQELNFHPENVNETSTK